MYIKKIKVHNFRLLKDFSIDLEKELSLIIGKNNTGKTSLLQLLDKMLNNGENKIQYYDLNLDYRKSLVDDIIAEQTRTENEYKQDGIKLRLYIHYDENDNLANLGKIIMDLDENVNTAVLGYDFLLDYDSYLELRKQYALKEYNTESEKVFAVDKILTEKLQTYFKLSKKSFAYDTSLGDIDEKKYIDLKKRPEFREEDLIAFGYIDARRDVANIDRDKTLSGQAAKLFEYIAADNDSRPVEEFQNTLVDADATFSERYKELFSSVIDKVSELGGISPKETKINIISTLEKRELLKGNTTVVYQHDGKDLPENLNGLGYMNLISMIFQIEIIRNKMAKTKNGRLADINLLIIEEPEAHTHPQMQYIFIKNIKQLLAHPLIGKDSAVRNIQSIISSHSSHIGSECDFNDIKYMSRLHNANAVISKNMKDLEKEYDDKKAYYSFLKHYLTLSKSELFFADKAIFIEGDTERILLPVLMKKIDQEELCTDGETPLTQQNISIIEVGAYSHIFAKFINFIGLKKTIVFTDLDCGEKTTSHINKCRYDAKKVLYTTNYALRTYFNTDVVAQLVVKTDSDKTFSWDSDNSQWKQDIDGSFKVYYQVKEADYQARSFEDGFFHINKKFLSKNKDSIVGLDKNKLSKFLDPAQTSDAYELAETGIESKATFAVEIIYNSQKNEGKDFCGWNIPKYIKEGLLWIRK